jgi:2-keto-myo-inositol isomerase
MPIDRTRPFVCMHQVSSIDFDFKSAMEGYSRAGIRAVEVVLAKAREFADQESPAAARRLLDDLGLTAASASNHLGAVEPNPDRAKNLDALNAKCELARALGSDKLVVVPAMTTTPTEDDYRKGIDHLREAGDIASRHGITLIFEFSKFFTFANSLTTALMLVRAAGHPHVGLMLDTYHFWVGVSKLEDLDLLHDGELRHLHIEDMPAEPVRELLEQRHRVLPGEGIAPLRRILEILKRKGYRGAASVELMDPSFQRMDPYGLATKVRAALEPLLV